MKLLVQSIQGPENAVNGVFPIMIASQAAEAGHEVSIFLAGNAVSLMKTEKENMKKIVITLFLQVLFTSSVYAKLITTKNERGSCPMMAKSLDIGIKLLKLLKQTLRDQGMAAHDAGDHAKSEELLNKALELFKS